MAQLVKNPPAMQETQVPSLGQEDPLEKGMATHSSILAWRILWTTGLQRAGHNRATFTFLKWVGCFLPSCLSPHSDSERLISSLQFSRTYLSLKARQCTLILGNHSLLQNPTGPIVWTTPMMFNVHFFNLILFALSEIKAQGCHNYCCCSSCRILCNHMDCSLPGSSVLHYLPEFAQVHIQWVSDSIQPSHPLPPLLLLPSIFPGISVFSNEMLVLYLKIKWKLI